MGPYEPIEKGFLEDYQVRVDSLNYGQYFEIFNHETKVAQITAARAKELAEFILKVLDGKE